MRSQQQIWEQEHQQGTQLPSETSSVAIEPSNGVVQFFEWLKQKGVQPPLRVIDIGCGKGRNALYAAQLGHDVTAMDYIQSAIAFVQSQTQQKGMTERIHVVQHAMDSQWPFADESFDLAIDSFASIDIETRQGREMYKREMLRTLKPGGYALVMVVSADDELEKEMIAQHPGEEPNSCFWPSGKFQKDYNEDELRAFYADFEIVELKKLSKKAEKLGRSYTATNFWMIVKKRT